MVKVWGSYKDGSDIYKNKKGFYIISWNPKTDIMSKKYLKSLKKYINSKPISHYRKSSKKKVKKTKKKTKKRK
tara:strand:- start:57 stop:275 length:219 start_codon:yes stop_codon:yes gene_type:complete